MINHSLLQFEVEQKMARSGDIDAALIEYLEDLRREQRTFSLRTRLAGLFVGFALRLDPRAVSLAGRLDVQLVKNE